MHDDAEAELSDVKDAQSQNAAIEGLDAQLVSSWQDIYGMDALRQLRGDVAARNEARENALTEWLRAITEVNDDITSALNFQYVQPYQNNELDSHYTASTTAASSAAKYSKLVDADVQQLSARLQHDIADTKSHIAMLTAAFPVILHDASSR